MKPQESKYTLFRYSENTNFHHRLAKLLIENLHVTIPMVLACLFAKQIKTLFIN